MDTKKNLAISGVGLAAAAWLFLHSSKSGTAKSGAAVVTEAKVQSASPVPTNIEATAKAPRNVQPRRMMSAGEAAPSQAKHVEPAKVYENPADNPDSWTDFQASVYAYKAEVLGPHIKKCWHTVGGSGRLVAEHNYEIVDGLARPALVTLEPDTEPVPDISIKKVDESLSEQDIEAALACLRAAATETEFHIVGLNGETDLNDTFTGFWGWSTPSALKERAEARREEQEALARSRAEK